MTFGVRMTSGPGRWSGRRRLIRRGTGTTYRRLQSLKFLLTRDRGAIADFLRAQYPRPFPLRARLELIRAFLHVTHHVRGYHTLAEILTVADRILKRESPVVVEAGAGSGSSTAKLSLATRIAGGRLYVFDTFQGIPANDEAHHLLDGRRVQFRKGAFRGRLSAVRRRIERYGAIEVCEFHKGLFEETLPGFDRTADVVLLDVDLISSTRTCTKHLFGRLAEDGVLFSQDGHIRETVELFRDEAFWRGEVGVEPPRIDWSRKLIEIRR